MAETVAQKRSARRMCPSQPRLHEGPNWLFTCVVCGEPILFEEPLVTWTQRKEVKVAHVRCAPKGTVHQEG